MRLYLRTHNSLDFESQLRMLARREVTYMRTNTMSRSLLHRTRFPRAIIAIGIVALAASCDRESPTDVSQARPPVKANRGVELPPIEEPPKPISGYEIKTFGIDVPGGEQGVVEVQCSPGNHPLGGGYQIGGPILINDADAVVYESSPRVTAGTDGWRLAGVNRSAATRRFDVWVICAPV